MKLVTRQILANGVTERWLRQYPKKDYEGCEKWIIYERLVSLGDNPNPDDVNKVIGNNSWTSIECDICGRSVDKAIEADVSGYDSHICFNCIDKAKGLNNEN